MKPTPLNFPLLFVFPNNIDSLITSLRTITSYFLLKNSICSLQSIQLKSLKSTTTKLIELVKDQNNDIMYFEHPKIGRAHV